ncbi:MAG: flavodoxin [Bacillota bacterium]|nr:flavodoxin [Bacillota bacterium]
MKKTKWICMILLVLTMAFGLAGCGEDQKAEEEPQQTEAAETQDAGEHNALVVYFSRTGEQYEVGEINKGNTAIVAEMIAEEMDADLFEVMPEEDYYPYTYDELTDVAKKEQEENARPAYQKDNVPDLSGYDTVFIGAPVWWGDWPMIMYTFFEDNAEALAGKTLVPFSTHEGSGLSGFDTKLAEVCPDSDIAEGLAIQGSDAQNQQDSVRSEVKNWLQSL